MSTVQKEVAQALTLAGYNVTMMDYDFNVGAMVEKQGKRCAVSGPSALHDKEAARRFWGRPAKVIADEMIRALEAWEPTAPTDVDAS